MIKAFFSFQLWLTKMQLLIRGQKIKLSELSNATQLNVGITINTIKPLVLDVSCFGLDAENKLSDDSYFIFYNQKTSPCGSLKSLGSRNGDQEQFQIDLSRLPATIRKLVFVVTIEGEGVMSQIIDGHLRVIKKNDDLAMFSFSGSDFKNEKAVMIAEIYIKDTWRLAAVGQGFNGGLSALLKHFGGEEKPSEPQLGSSLKVNFSKAISLEKRLEKEAPQLVNLAKKLAVTLEKKQLQDIVAKVAIVMDASGSMTVAYKQGSVQAVLDRMVLVAARLDDDGILEAWFYASKHVKFPGISIENITNYLKKNVKSGFGTIVKGLGFGNNEPPVMQEILDTYKSSDLPALVIFITDGGIYEEKNIKRILIEASGYPIFWQFVGLAGSNYGILEDLDTMAGRKVDNAGFFQVDDLAHISDEELYERLLNEFPIWLKNAKRNGIIA
ncbi:VWA domain-containing protein [uncultured Thiodictyon sp.]|uniref:VWA domain-containing protein n=1 Tax=uncultured Thiodictyon sp. TaxID=1846217 RepID=UPI0025D7368D|nr:VWA domain-containing protein [uncultured Thiodictyon sp.]